MVALPSSPTPAEVNIKWAANSLSYRSPLSGAIQTSARLGGQWMIDLTMPPMTRYQAGEWEAVLFGADGFASAIDAGPDHQHPLDWYDASANTHADEYATTLYLDFVTSDYRVRYITAPTVLVNGAASAQATTLAVDGLDGVGLNRGDWFSVSNGTYSELHMVTADAFPNSSGEATLSIHPPLRRAVSDNVAVTIENPKGEFILADNDTAGSVLDNRGVTSISQIKLMEFVR